MRRLLFLFAFGWLFAIAPQAGATTFRLEYEGSILNLVAFGRASVEGTIGPERYAAAVTVHTSGVAQLFDDTRLQARTTGAVVSGALGWSRYALDHAYARKSRRVVMSRDGRGVQATIAPNYRDLGNPPASAAQRAASFDPVSALVAMARAIGRSGRCEGRFLVFDGRQHYAVTLSAGGRGTYRGGGYAGPAVICRARYTPLAGYKPLTAEDRARIPLVEIWFAPQNPAGFSAPLRISAPTPLGEARVDLKSMDVRP